MPYATALRRFCLSLLGRRHTRRTPAGLAVDWHVFGSAVHHRSRAEDLSQGGAMVSSVKPVPVGSPLVVALATGRGPLELHARVAWSESTRMGIRFTRPVDFASALSSV
jgi:PilZ domain